MSDFTTSKLSALITHARAGGTPDTSIEKFYGGDIPFVSIEDMTSCSFELKNVKKSLTEEGLKNSAAYIFDKGNILYSMYATVGEARLTNQQVSMSQAIIGLVPNTKKIQTEYLVHYLNYVKPKVLLEAAQTTQANLNAERVKNILVAYPSSLLGQKRIAEILSAVDEQITLIETKIEKTRLLHTGVEQKFSILFAESNFSDLKLHFNVLGGKRLPAGHDYAELSTKWKYLRVVDFYRRQIDPQKMQCLNFETFLALSRYQINAGDIYISIAGSIGYCGVFSMDDHNEAILTENAAKITQISNVFSSEFVSTYLNSPSGQRQIWERIGTGGGVPKLALQRIETLKLPLIDFELQEQYVDTLKTLESQVVSLENSLTKLKLTKNGLMDDLLTGKTRVSC